TATTSETNPLFASAWDTPYGAPPFAKIQESHYGPAFDEGMRRHREEDRAIAEQEEAPTFDNTIAALERSGEMLNKVALVFFNLTATDSNEALQALEETYAPRLAAHSDHVMLNPKIFARVEALIASQAD